MSFKILNKILKEKGNVVFNKRTKKDVLEVLGISFNVKFKIYEHKEYFDKMFPFIKKDLDKIIKLLQKDPTTRQAIINFWPKELQTPKKLPCFIILNYLIRNNKLWLFVYQRSLNIDRLSRDVSFMCHTSKIIEKKLNIKLINIKFFVGSFHRNLSD